MSPHSHYPNIPNHLVFDLYSVSSLNQQSADRQSPHSHYPDIPNHLVFDLYSVSSLNQQSTDRHVAPLTLS